MNSLCPRNTDLSEISHDCSFQTMYRKIVVCWEKMNEDISAKQVCKCFICVSKQWSSLIGQILEEFIGKSCLNFSCPGRPSQMRNVFIWGDFPSNNTTQNQPKPTAKLMQTSWFRQILQFACDACTLFGRFCVHVSLMLLGYIRIIIIRWWLSYIHYTVMTWWLGVVPFNGLLLCKSPVSNSSYCRVVHLHL